MDHDLSNSEPGPYVAQPELGGSGGFTKKQDQQGSRMEESSRSLRTVRQVSPDLDSAACLLDNCMNPAIRELSFCRVV